MILVDTLVWIDQLCSGDKALVRAQDNNEVLTHSFVLGELACGNLGSSARTSCACFAAGRRSRHG